MPQTATAQTATDQPSLTASSPPQAAAAPPVAPAPAAGSPAYDFRNADGTPADPTHAQELAALAAELKVAPEHAGKLYQRDLTRAQAQEAALAAEWDKQAQEAERLSRADPVIGGDKFEQTLTHAKLMSEKYSPPGFSIWDVAERLGVVRDPNFLHFMNNIYLGQREPNSIANGQPVGQQKPKSAGEVFYPEMYAKKES